MKNRAWAAFWITGIIWGSSFMFIRIGVQELRTVEVVFIRTAIAALGLSLVIALRRVPVPKGWRTRRALILIGLGNVVAPFMLITWSEQFITSGLAAVLQASAALFALVIAHFLFADDRITPQKVLGLITGFVGVVVLFSDKLASGEQNAVAGMLGMVLASLCYATFTSLGRKVIQGNVAPIVVAGSSMLVAATATAPLAFLTEGGFTPLASVTNDTLIAMLMLGLLNTFIAYLFYYFVVAELGVARASMVTYIVPPVGVILGALFLQEPVGITLVMGGGLIFVGIAIVNLRLRRFRSARGAAHQAAKP